MQVDGDGNDASGPIALVRDSRAYGRHLKCLTVVDDFSHETVDIVVDCGISGPVCDATAGLCRYTTRPALANERVQTNAAGQLVVKLKTHWSDGTTHLVISPLELMQRLASLIPLSASGRQFRPANAADGS